MVTRRGAPRKLNDLQVQRVLQWRAHGIAFLKSQGTILQITQRFNVSVRTVKACVLQGDRFDSDAPRGGRKQILDRQQREWVLAWHAANRRHRAEHGSATRLALELGVSPRTIYLCIRRGGVYKTAYRDDLSSSCALATRPCAAVQPSLNSQFGPHRDNDSRNALLRAWRLPVADCVSMPVEEVVSDD